MTSDPEMDDRHRTSERRGGTEPGLEACSAYHPPQRPPRAASLAPVANAPSGPVRLADLARAWIAVGTQSIGGASSTVYLMRLRLVERTGWLTRREFMESYSLSQLSPGIHLVALAGLIGHRLAGIRGVGVSVAGMMVPAAIITVALSAALSGAAGHPLTGAAFAGIGPVTAGMTAGLAVISARGTVRRGARGALDVAVIALAFLAFVGTAISPAVVIIAFGLAGIVALRHDRPETGRGPESE